MNYITFYRTCLSQDRFSIALSDEEYQEFDLLSTADAQEFLSDRESRAFLEGEEVLSYGEIEL